MAKKKSRKKEGYLQSILASSTSKKESPKKFSLNQLASPYNKKSIPKTRKGKNRRIFQTLEDECFVPVTARQIMDLGITEKREGQLVISPQAKESVISKLIPMIVGALVVIVSAVVLALILRYLNR